MSVTVVFAVVAVEVVTVVVDVSVPVSGAAKLSEYVKSSATLAGRRIVAMALVRVHVTQSAPIAVTVGEGLNVHSSELVAVTVIVDAAVGTADETPENVVLEVVHLLIVDPTVLVEISVNERVAVALAGTQLELGLYVSAVVRVYVVVSVVALPEVTATEPDVE